MHAVPDRTGDPVTSCVFRNCPVLPHESRQTRRVLCMAEGIRALVRAAERGPLSFRVVLYCGGMQVTGRIAPASWWYDVTINADRAAAEAARAGKGRWRRGPDDQRERTIEAEQRRFQSELGIAAAAEGDADEVTLVDVWIYPADLRADSSTGGQSLPVARIPLASIDLWYVFSGETLKQAGATSSSVGWGVLFPIG